MTNMNQSEEVTNTSYPIITIYHQINKMNSFLILLIVALLCLVSVQSFSVSKINRFQLAKHVNKFQQSSQCHNYNLTNTCVIYYR